METTSARQAESSNNYIASMVIRGEVIEDNLVEFGGRGPDNFRFLSPDPHRYVDKLPLRNPSSLGELYQLSFEDILEYLTELGKHLELKSNRHLQQALEGSYLTAPTTAPIVEYSYKTLCKVFQPEVIKELVELTVGIRYLEGWVPEKLADGRTAHIRAFGSRALHIIAGNAPTISAITIARNAVTRSDAIIKSPSNDPFTALAIAKTMCDIAPDHPLTRHLTVAYWKGGDVEFERQLYQPHNIEKILAWGGLASVKHVTKYIQPGLELISLDPKRSISVIGEEVFNSETAMRDAAHKLAVDFAGMNQCGCVNSRKAYVKSGTDEEGLEKLKILGEYTYQAMLEVPPHMSTKPKDIDTELKANVDAIRLQDDWYHVIGGDDNEGAVIVSLIPEEVSFAEYLGNRTLNMIPIDNEEDVLQACDAYTQTIGVYPETFKKNLRDKLPLYGAQRIVSLGYALTSSYGLPQDAIEPLRRACKWIVDEQSVPEVIPPVWPAV